MNSSITRLLKNYSNARQSWESWCYMINYNCKERNLATLEYIDKNDLLFHLRYLAMKDFHIELYKVLKENKNNQDNIFKLLKNVPESDPIKKKNANENLIELENNKNTIKELCDIRDKFYAHLDEDYQDYLITRTQLSNILRCFMAIEGSLITLASLNTLQSYLDKIPSRDELHF